MLCFGGVVWWFPPVLAIAALVMVLARLLQCALIGRMAFLKSPLTAVGLLALGLGVLQLAPLPSPLRDGYRRSRRRSGPREPGRGW